MKLHHYFKTICEEKVFHARRFMHEHKIGHHHGPGGRQRLLEHGDLRVLVLHLIDEAPRHGYELIKAVEDLSGGTYAPSPGVIYPTLTMLEELGHISATANSTKRLFNITEAGKETLDASRAVLDVMLARLASGPGRDAVMPVRRAMENLKTALRMKLGGRTANPEAMRQATDMIDELVRKIEAL